MQDTLGINNYYLSPDFQTAPCVETLKVRELRDGNANETVYFRTMSDPWLLSRKPKQRAKGMVLSFRVHDNARASPALGAPGGFYPQRPVVEEIIVSCKSG